jgi:hypothetical protein
MADKTKELRDILARIDLINESSMDARIDYHVWVLKADIERLFRWRYDLERLTIEDIESLEPCYSREKLERIFENFSNNGTLSLVSIANMPIPEDDKQWLLDELFEHTDQIEPTKSNLEEIECLAKHLAAVELESDIEDRLEEAREEGREEGEREGWEACIHDGEEWQNGYSEGYDDGVSEGITQVEDSLEDLTLVEALEKIAKEKLGQPGPDQNDLLKQALTDVFEKWGVK